MRNQIVAVVAIGMLIIGFGTAFVLKPPQTETSTFTTTLSTVVSTFTTTISTPVTVTENFNRTTTVSVYTGGRLVGTCATDNYLVTVTSDSSTTYLGGSSYMTTLGANTTGTFTIYSTTTFSSPYVGGIVTVCTFSG